MPTAAPALLRLGSTAAPVPAPPAAAAAAAAEYGYIPSTISTGGLHLGAIYRQLLQLKNGQPQPQQFGSVGRAGAAAAAECPDTVASLSNLMFMSQHRVQQLIDRHPEVIDMPLAHVAQRLLLLKQLLPQCDVARMIELQPRLLLGCDCCYLTDVVKPRLEVLTAGLPGADIAAMVQEDPRLLFEEIESSLPRFNELWPATCLDASAFAASDPAELALALRALSDQGPPRRY
ncbi:hypothetical protein COO60DRAFT_1701150 [Scenedesmus sp. NREL 46B-D3]|nr:hypothetical protein COO60DRAFT_1701150 [Scenedesmus sp. NREL 46B-D3]